MPGNVLVPNEPTAPFFSSKMYACCPTATSSEPVLSSTEKLVATLDETNKETQSFTICNPRFAGNLPTVNLSSSVEEV